MMSKELGDAGRPRQVNPCRDFGFIFIYTDMLDSLERWRDRSLVAEWEMHSGKGRRGSRTPSEGAWGSPDEKSRWPTSNW